MARAPGMVFACSPKVADDRRSRQASRLPGLPTFLRSSKMLASNTCLNFRRPDDRGTGAAVKERKQRMKMSKAGSRWSEEAEEPCGTEARMRLLLAAEKLFAERGAVSVSVRDLAREAKV